MNPTHHETDHSAGLHLLQELSTLDQRLADALLLRRHPLAESRPRSPAHPRMPDCARSSELSRLIRADSVHFIGVLGLSPWAWHWSLWYAGLFPAEWLMHSRNLTRIMKATVGRSNLGLGVVERSTEDKPPERFRRGFSQGTFRKCSLRVLESSVPDPR
jgi:hypothetical protein